MLISLVNSVNAIVTSIILGYVNIPITLYSNKLYLTFLEDLIHELKRLSRCN